MDVFEAVKQAVTTRQAAEHYGIHVGRNGMACCPFHKDKTPSLKVDKRFHCFGCQADGDVIDFAARLFDLSGVDAARRLAADFGIPYDSRGRSLPKPVKRSIPAELRFLQAEQKCFHLLGRWRTEHAPKSPEDTWHPLFAEALQKQEYVGYLLDTLLTGGAKEKADIIIGHGKEVERLEKRISELTGSHKERTASRSRQPER